MLPWGFAGMVAGILLWSRLVRYLYLFFPFGKSPTRATPSEDLTDRTLRKFLEYLFAASCAWISVFVTVAIHFTPPNISGIGWFWFFGGMATTPLFIWATTLKVVRKLKQRKAQGTQPSLFVQTLTASRIGLIQALDAAQRSDSSSTTLER